jgi:hypothetical protein
MTGGASLRGRAPAADRSGSVRDILAFDSGKHVVLICLKLRLFEYI